MLPIFVVAKLHLGTILGPVKPKKIVQILLTNGSDDLIRNLLETELVSWQGVICFNDTIQ